MSLLDKKEMNIKQALVSISQTWLFLKITRLQKVYKKQLNIIMKFTNLAYYLLYFSSIDSSLNGVMFYKTLSFLNNEASSLFYQNFLKNLYFSHVHH